MPANRSFPQIRGQLNISSGEHRLAIEGTPGRLILRVGSMGTLMEIRKTVSRLIPDSPGTSESPIHFTDLPETIIALGSRPIARIDLVDGKPKITPTPLKALTSKV